MSADNWTYCPNCKAKHDSAMADNKKRVEASYGKVPAEKYIESLKELENPTEAKSTLREDYELGICEDGSFYCSYSASCKECDFSFKFKREMTAKEVLVSSKRDSE